MDVHSWAVRDRRREQFFEVPLYLHGRGASRWPPGARFYPRFDRRRRL